MDTLTFSFACLLSITSATVIIIGVMTFYLPRKFKEANCLVYSLRIYLFGILVICILNFIRPFWEDDVNDNIYNSPIACSLFARGHISKFAFMCAPIFFSYFKTDFYQKVIPNARSYRLLAYSLAIGPLLALMLIIFFEPKTYVSVHGVKSCHVVNNVVQILAILFIIWLGIEFGLMISIFRQTHDTLDQLLDAIPEFQTHLLINRYFCPIMFASTFISFVFSGIWVNAKCNNAIGPGLCSWKMYDFTFLANAVCDSCVMFYTIYGPFQKARANQSIRSSEPWFEQTEDRKSDLIHQQTLRSEFQSFLHDLIAEDEINEWGNLIPILVDFMFYPEGTKVYIHFPQIEPICIISDTLERNPYLNAYAVTDQKDIDKLYWANDRVHNHQERMDAIDYGIQKLRDCRIERVSEIEILY